MKHHLLLAALAASLLAGCGDSPSPSAAPTPVSFSAPTSVPTPTATPEVIQLQASPPPAMFQEAPQNGNRGDATLDQLKSATASSGEATRSSRVVRRRGVSPVTGSPTVTLPSSEPSLPSRFSPDVSSSSSASVSSCSGGASAVCSDGSLSYSANHRGTCSHHGGVAQWCD